MALEARQTIQQRLLLAPNLTVALEILRMPTMELQVYLRQQAEENPLLEVDDLTDDPPSDEADANLETNTSLDDDWSSNSHTAS